MKLADGNLLIAKIWKEHDDHDRAERFFADNKRVATCAITELNVVRVLMQRRHTGNEANRLLENFISQHRSRFIGCDLSAAGISAECDGHRQTTDTYLARLAEEHDLTLATMDEPLKGRFPDLVELVD